MGHVNHADPAKQIYWITVGEDVKAIVAGITDSSASKPYTIYLNSGLYSIGDNSIAIPTYVALVAQGTVIFDYTGNTTKTAFSMAAGSRIEGVTIQNHQSTSYGVEITSSGNYIIDGITFSDCSLGILANNAALSLTVRGLTLLNSSAAMTTGLKCEAGNVTIYDLYASIGVSLTNLVWADGSSTDLHVFNATSYSSGVTNALYATNGGALEVNAALIKNATYGIHILSSGEIYINASNMTACTYGMYADGNGSTLYGFALNLEGNTTYDVYAGANTVIKGIGVADSSKFYYDASVSMQAGFLDTVEENEAFAITAELYNGTPTRGRVSAFGEGQDYVNGMLVYTYDGTTYTDVSVAARSSTGSTFTFPNNNVNTAIYVATQITRQAGGFHQFLGIEFLTTIAQSGGTIVAEYYNGAWTEFARCLHKPKAHITVRLTACSHSQRVNTARVSIRV